MKYKTGALFISLILVMAALTGCGNNGSSGSVDMSHYAGQNDVSNGTQTGTPSIEEIEAAMKTDEALYVVISKDELAKTIKLGLQGSYKIIQYSYGELTDFYDRYGSYTTVEKMIPGTVVTIGKTNNEGDLTSISVSDQAWYQSDVTKYDINTELGMLTIGSTKYVVDEYSRIFSAGNEIRLEQIDKDDVIDVQGVDKNVLSIVVTRGHGTIALTNTEIFEGGWLCLGTKIYTIIEPDMTMVVPEGKYEFSVANDGYGDKKTIRVRRDKITVVDLNEYMGDGPSMCELTFEVNIEGAELYIDGEKVDYSEPMQVRYGVHDLVVIAKGYDDWQQKLAVGSKKATIQIGEKDLKENPNKKDDKEENSKSEGNTNNTTENTTNDTTDNNEDRTDNTTNSDTENNNEDEDVSPVKGDNSGSETDYTQYIDTLNNLIDSLTNDANRQNA